MVVKSPRQGGMAKFERDLRSEVDGYKLSKEEEEEGILFAGVFSLFELQLCDRYSRHSSATSGRQIVA